jgi:hypothetical protein
MRFGIFPLLALFVFCAANTAQARDRDDVMSRAFHCARIANSHQWLDCYYGAGLPPAPAAQVQLVDNPPASDGNPVDQPVRDAVMSGAFRCTSLDDERQWLNCYYGAAQPMRAALGLPPSGLPSPPKDTAQPLSAQQDSPQQFGIKQTRQSLPPKDRVVSALATYSFDRNGFFTVKLANGQVWRQLKGDTMLAHWKKEAANYRATISHGAIGSYNLIVDNNPGMFKVERVE